MDKHHEIFIIHGEHDLLAAGPFRFAGWGTPRFLPAAVDKDNAQGFVGTAI